MVLSKNAVDPDSIAKNPAYSSHFKVEVHFKDVCRHGCKPIDILSRKCEMCQKYMKEDLMFWQIIQDILAVSFIYFNRSSNTLIQTMSKE